MHFKSIILCIGITLICFEFSLGALFYPTNSAYGLFAAIAVPLDLPHRNVFVSYNFEANYNLPSTWNLPPYAAGVEEDDDIFTQGRHIESEDECSNCSTTAQTSSEVSIEETISTTTEETPLRNATKNAKRKQRSLLTRTHFYQVLMDKFERSGYSGESCLLRLICEINDSALADINGVLGSLVHIIFTPSTSMSENLPLVYYQAELDGKHEQCHHYINDCKESILDIISTPVNEIVNSFVNNYNNNNNEI